MAGALTQRPAMGELVPIGTLYDAKTDRFLPQSLFKKEIPVDAITISLIEQKFVHSSFIDSYEEKLKQMSIGSELAASILAGLTSPSGSGLYLEEKFGSSRYLHAALYHKIAKLQENLNMASGELKSCLGTTSLRTSEVTHVVTGIEWGVQSIVTATQMMPENPWIPASTVETQFLTAFEDFKSAIDSSRLYIEGVNGQQSAATQLDITVYSDIFASEGIMVHSFQEAYNFLDLVPSHIECNNDGKGVPTMYTLFPIAMLGMFMGVQVNQDITPVLPSNDCLQEFVQLLDQFRTSKQTLTEHQSYVQMHRLYMPEDHLMIVEEAVSNMTSAEDNLRMEYARLLQAVRGGIVGPEKLQQLLRNSREGGLSPVIIGSAANFNREKIDFIDTMVSKGAKYIGYNRVNLKAELSRQGNNDAYVLWFNTAARADSISWEGNEKLILRKLNEDGRKTFIAIFDCDAAGLELEKARISHFKNQQELSDDLLEQEQFFVDKCFARCPQPSPETKNFRRPVKRRFVKTTCPSQKCNQGEICEWICCRCLGPIEYGYTDEYIYCDCGRSLYTSYDFKCKSARHGSGFARYEPDIMLQKLKKLDVSDYLNILILGETGVGKSTFINAFVNYVTFGTLDEAMKADELNWLIPCSFSIQTMDRTRPNSEIHQEEISVGNRSDEKDGSKGASATQQTMVYAVNTGTTTIRLIDTPGIGDTRGLEYDKKNMADILSTLSGYDDLHGIIILLKSNNSRLTVTFRFCVKELLVHLHRSAAKNMVFGFTNTRISNYMPGDTFSPLQALLKEHSDVGLSLSNATTYCFDSESFRYLAAYKKGVTMDNEEDFRRSWKHSSEEANRLLDHFRGQTPHQIKNTLSLNGVREQISQLTKPMADISLLIKRNMAMVVDKVQELHTTRLTGDDLKKRLNLQKVQLKSKTLDYPRTVCADQSCVDYKDDGSGETPPRVITVYKTHCHTRCYLDGIKADAVGCPGLISCAAFSGNVDCTNCGHHWASHLHVLYEQYEETVTVQDKAIEAQIGQHASTITLKQTAIKKHDQTIDEYRKEHEKIRQAAAQFGLFLKKHSITPINDATVDYLEFHIKDEKGKINAGGNNNRLKTLENDLQRHKELVASLDQSMKSGGSSQLLNEAGVMRLIDELYKMPHFGKQLKSVNQTVGAAYQPREMPHRVKSRGGSGSYLPGIYEGMFGSGSSSTHHSGSNRYSSSVSGPPRSYNNQSSHHQGWSSGGSGSVLGSLVSWVKR